MTSFLRYGRRFALLLLVLLFCGCSLPDLTQSGSAPSAAQRPTVSIGAVWATPTVSHATATLRATRARPTASPRATAPRATAPRATATAARKPSATVVVPQVPRIAGFTAVTPNKLPPEAQQTLALIAKGGPFPYRQDGVVFQNRERILPRNTAGYYHEYTVKTPGEGDRGARRIITGANGEIFYTGDHYASFVQVLPQ